MLPADLVEYFAGRARAAVRHIVKTLPDRLMDVSPRGDVKQTLIPFRVLHNGLGLSFDG
jgi:hypothetical protein